MLVCTEPYVTTKIADCELLVDVILNVSGVSNAFGFPSRPTVALA